MIATANNTASAQNMPRQPSSGNNHCTGSVDASMPSEPVINIHELARNWALWLKRCLNSVSGAIRQALTPMPISARARVSPTKLRARAKAAQPITASARKPISTRCGPKRSRARPSGSCMTAKPTKYAPASSPRSAAPSPISALKSGANVAVTPRTRAEKK